jgi:uncharacterized protein (TIGR02271 family)
MSTNSNTLSNRSGVVAFFNSPASAETAMAELRRAGFRSDQIGCSCDEDYASNGTIDDGRSFWDKVSHFFSGSDESDQVVGERHDLRVPDRYYDRLTSGGAFVSVYEPSRTAEATEILRRTGGEIERDYNAFEPVGRDTRQAKGERRIQLLSERLRVHKERVSQGEVRLRKDVHTERQNINVPVTREELVVEHVPTSGRRAPGEEIGRDQEIRVPLSEERVRVEKEPVVRDEVRVTKKPVEEVRSVSDDVRREELRVDDDRN